MNRRYDMELLLITETMKHLASSHNLFLVGEIFN